MDPDEVLRLLRLAVDEAATCGRDPEQQRLAALEATEHFLALDDWICHGGFLPSAWRRP